MSRQPNAAQKTCAVVDIKQKISTEQQAERLQYSSNPNIKGIDTAVKRISELFGVEVTEYYLRRAITKRRLQRHEICHVIHFSDRDLYDFIVLGTKKVSA